VRSKREGSELFLKAAVPIGYGLDRPLVNDCIGAVPSGFFSQAVFQAIIGGVVRAVDYDDANPVESPGGWEGSEFAQHPGVGRKALPIVGRLECRAGASRESAKEYGEYE